MTRGAEVSPISDHTTRVGRHSPPTKRPSPERPTMNDRDSSPASAIALRILRGLADLGHQDLPRPLLIRFGWFCAGAAFMLASARLAPSGRPMQ